VSQRQIFDKTIQANQLNVVEAHGILLFRTEKGTYVFYNGEQQHSTCSCLFEKTPCYHQSDNIAVVNGYYFVVAGRDSKIYVFRLSEFDADVQTEVKSKPDLKDHKLERTRGCSMYAISKPGGSRLKMVNIL
jgi:hypothetical protein